MKRPVMKYKEIVDGIISVNYLTGTIGFESYPIAGSENEDLEIIVSIKADELYELKDRLTRDLLTWYKKYRIEYLFGDSLPTVKKVRNRYKIPVGIVRDDYYGLWRFVVYYNNKPYTFHIPAPLLRTRKRVLEVSDIKYRFGEGGREFKTSALDNISDVLREFEYLLENFGNMITKPMELKLFIMRTLYDDDYYDYDDYIDEYEDSELPEKVILERVYSIRRKEDIPYNEIYNTIEDAKKRYVFID